MLSDCLRCACALVSAGLDYVAALVLRTELSVMGMFTSLCDLRGMCIWSALPVGAAEFRGTIAVVVGDLGDISLGIAATIARGGADAVHLVSASSGKLSVAAGLLREGGGTGNIVPHDVDFMHPGRVAEWCRDICRLLHERGQRVGVVVLSSVAVTPKDLRFTRDALDQAFTADVVALRALLAGLRPALLPGARVIITASAACCWLSRISREALTGAADLDARWLSTLQARAQQQAARIVLAGHQARKWAAEEEGPVCVSCTPSVGWSAWTDLLALTGVLDRCRYIERRILCVQRSKAAVQSRIASTVAYLCSRGARVAPGEYYWGPNLCDASRNVTDDDIGRMLVVLALRSGQLPG